MFVLIDQGDDDDSVWPFSYHEAMGGAEQGRKCQLKNNFSFAFLEYTKHDLSHPRLPSL